ncbi:DUF1573 domain-containing protein [Bacteroides thetaiotaomicron]|nr:DUF1573 domain-containing protein [Bacteroides thetaiotaomicron]MCS3210613.1 DUF1573 domain-containing protein [Bacteroides thetaiotaomicron]
MNEEEPVFSFSNEVIDLGTIDKKKNEFVTTSFQFANMGTKPLVIKKWMFHVDALRLIMLSLQL